MKKRIFSLVLAIVMSLIAVIVISAYTKDQEKSADALNELGLFLGDGISYDLDSKLNRVEAITLLVRMIGKEAEAKTGTYKTPFTDVPTWAKGYVGYAYVNKITLGVADDLFGSEQDMTDYMFLTLTLRALGYKDTGDNPSFSWKEPYEQAKNAGLIEVAKADNDFTRGDAVVIFWNALCAEFADGSKTLAEDLIYNGIFTSAKFENAKDIQKNGRKTNPGVPMTPGNIEETENSEITKPSETTKTPETTKSPETTKTPETTKSPETTKTPETTKAPNESSDTLPKDPDEGVII